MSHQVKQPLSQRTGHLRDVILTPEHIDDAVDGVGREVQRVDQVQAGLPRA